MSAPTNEQLDEAATRLEMAARFLRNPTGSEVYSPMQRLSHARQLIDQAVIWLNGSRG